MKKEIKPPIHSEDAEHSFTYLPSEIMIDILLRLPNETIKRCKFVCNAWRDLLETRDFVQSHFFKSVPGLAVYASGENSKRYRIVEFVDDEDRLNIVFSVDLPFISSCYIEHSSANGLLFVCNRYDHRRDVSFVCNPITREYIRLPSPREASPRPTNYDVIYGFGVSKMSGEYKVVRISLDEVNSQVYTVGSGSWRRIEFDDQLRYKGRTAGAFLNGNLHWVAYNKHSYHHDLICCFDFETERFNTFSSPPYPRRCSCYNYRILSVLGDYPCVCDTFVECGMVRDIEIWLMKEYGDEKSWIKEFHFDSGYGVGPHCPIKVFKDGDILMEWGNVRSSLLYYSKKHGSETIEKVDLFKDDYCSTATIYAPSFLPLKTFAMENVSSF